MNPHVVLAWEAGGKTGWQLLGTHLALGLAREGCHVSLGAGFNPDGVPLPLVSTLSAMQGPPPDGVPVIVLSANGNHFAAPPAVTIGNPVQHACIAVFEDSALDVDGRADRLNQFDAVIVPSRWCRDQLAKVGIESTVIVQGYDASVFHPAERRRGHDGRYLIFSGGKLEFRKGQDIVVEAFKRFRSTPDGKDAVLVTAWHNPWPQTMEGIWLSKYVKGVPSVSHGIQHTGKWLEANGIPTDAHLDLGILSQAEMANAVRECDVAVFPNRAEGASNMVLAETLALGIPCIASENTGHLEFTDLHEPVSLTALHTRAPVTLAVPSLYRGMDGWGETDPDHILHALYDYRNYAPHDRGIELFTWAKVAARYADALRDMA